MAKERVKVTSRVKIEKYNALGVLEEIHESKIPTEVGKSGVNPKDVVDSNNPSNPSNPSNND